MWKSIAEYIVLGAVTVACGTILLVMMMLAGWVFVAFLTRLGGIVQC